MARVTALGLVPVGVDPLLVEGARSVAVMRSCFRQRNMVTSRLLRSMHVAGRALASGGTREVLDEFSGDEVAAGLGWSRSMAGRWLELADDLVGRLPQVLELMERGVLDDGKARVLSEWTRDLSVEHVRLAPRTGH